MFVVLFAAWPFGAPQEAYALGGFPRLSLLWPRAEQSVAELARYDSVILNSWQTPEIAAIKAINPDALVLVSGNACEQYCDVSGGGTLSLSDVRSCPTQWFLTQVGTTLTSDIGSAATTFTVGRTNASGTTLLAAGDTILVGDEVCYIQAVNGTVLTVRRGGLKPATSHASGTRVASLVSFWPGTVIMDMSSNCPAMVVDPRVGPERWCDYQARMMGDRTNAAAWDGIYVDRSDGDESWVLSVSTGLAHDRSIDPDRSNTLVADGYAEFDTEWDAGLRVFMEKLRSRIGGKVFVGNGAMPNFDLLNGTFLEGFPSALAQWGPIDWRTAVFSTRAEDFAGAEFGGRDSYLQWTTQALSPNLTTVLTYQSENGGGNGTTPDYRNMRFALTTALLGDGLFSYQMAPSYPANTPLPWFDEYDGGGLGTGYFGRPLGPAREAIPALTTPDLLSGFGSFDTSAQAAAWSLWADTGYDATSSRDTGDAFSGAASDRIDVTRSGGVAWKVQLRRPVSVESGRAYTLTFRARADRPVDIGAYVQNDGGAYARYLDFQTVSLDGQWRTFELPANCSGTNAAAILCIALGEKAATIRLDDVKLQAGNRRDVFRRDFEHGVSIVNATDRPVTVDLGGTFRHLRGTQDPAVNDGSTVSAVTVPARDGLVLLRGSQALLRSSITIASSAASVSRTRPFVLSGTLSPGRLHDPCVVEVKKPGSGRWSYSSARLAYAIDTAGGALWWYRYTPLLRGTYWFRSRFAQDATREASMSRTIPVVVR